MKADLITTTYKYYEQIVQKILNLKSHKDQQK